MPPGHTPRQKQTSLTSKASSPVSCGLDVPDSNKAREFDPRLFFSCSWIWPFSWESLLVSKRAAKGGLRHSAKKKAHLFETSSFFSPAFLKVCARTAASVTQRTGGEMCG